MTSCDYLILGYGYTASFLKEFIKKKEPQAITLTTSRQGSPHIYFSLNDESSWQNLPHAKVTFWTFPAEPLGIVKNFYQQQQQFLGKLVVIGSTGSIKVHAPHQKVDESAELDQNLARVQGEEFLSSQGARLVLSSGIYGPQRNPLDWVKKGMVGRSQKWVNMIHVEDLCQFLYQAQKMGLSHKKYIASDNNPKVWQDVIDLWESVGLIHGTPEKESSRSSKRIDSSQSIEQLEIKLKYPDFAQAIINDF